MIGGLLTFGIFYAATGGGNSVTTSSSSGTQNASGETVVENVKVNVDSDITSAVDKVQGAVVSVINLQKQSSSSDPFGSLFGQQQESSGEDGELQAYSEGSGVIYKKRAIPLIS